MQKYKNTKYKSRKNTKRQKYINRSHTGDEPARQTWKTIHSFPRNIQEGLREQHNFKLVRFLLNFSFNICGKTEQLLLERICRLSVNQFPWVLSPREDYISGCSSAMIITWTLKMTFSGHGFRRACFAVRNWQNGHFGHHGHPPGEGGTD